MALRSALLAATLAALGCASADGELDRVGSGGFRVLDVFGRTAVVTGIGCGASEREALDNAQRVSSYNLRATVGSNVGRVTHRVLREVPDPNRICLEMEAREVR